MSNQAKLINANAFVIPKGFFNDAINVPKILELVAKQPTVDAVEVLHGKWENPYINRYGHPCHCCSICGFKASYQDKNYCPNCGAKMDGGSTNE